MEKVNCLLMNIYHNVKRLEEQTIKSTGRINLTFSELHTVACVGRSNDGSRTIREIADELKIKSPSATVAVNKLVAKGYLKKHQSDADGRVVYVTLTRDGKRIFAFHRYYHNLMVKRLMRDLDEMETGMLIKALDNLNNYLAESGGEPMQYF